MEEEIPTKPSTTGRISPTFDYITRRELFDITRRATAFKTSHKLAFLKEELIKQFNPTDMAVFNAEYSSFCKEFKMRWEKVGRHVQRFLNRNEDWLNTLITFLPKPKHHVPNNLLCKDSTLDDTDQIKLTSCTSFSKKVKLNARKDSKKCAIRNDTIKIKSPISKKANKGHKLTTQEDYKDKPIEENYPNPTQIKLTSTGSVTKINKLTPQEALCLLLDAELSAYQYNVLRKYTPEVYPPFSDVLKAKQPAVKLEK